MIILTIWRLFGNFGRQQKPTLISRRFLGKGWQGQGSRILGQEVSKPIFGRASLGTNQIHRKLYENLFYRYYQMSKDRSGIPAHCSYIVPTKCANMDWHPPRLLMPYWPSFVQMNISEREVLIMKTCRIFNRYVSSKGGAANKLTNVLQKNHLMQRSMK
jgi:hypothetical protein